MNINKYNPYKKGFDMLVADIEAHESKQIPYEERLQYAMDTALEIVRLQKLEAELTEYHQQLIAKIAVMEIKLIEREDGLHKLLDAARDNDTCPNRTLSTAYVRSICKVALGVKP